MKRLFNLCRELSEHRFPEFMTAQILRVLLHLTADSDQDELQTATDIIRVFRGSCRVPEVLMANRHVINNVLPFRPDALALLYSASCYPGQVNDSKGELDARIEAFITALSECLGNMDRYRDRSQLVYDVLSNLDRLPGTVSLDDFRQITHDISGLSGREDEFEKEGLEERRTGASLYLMTCTETMLATICENWQWENRDSKCVIRDFTGFAYCSPPSMITSRNQEVYPDWHCVAERLPQVYGLPADQDCQALIELDKMCWRKIGSWIEDPANVRDRVNQFWFDQFEKLNAGFPYYAFRSRFVHWWKVCLGNLYYDRREVALGEGENVPDQLTVEQNPGGTVMSVDFQRFVEEGYRLIRATFYHKREDHRDDQHIPAEVCNEKLRQILDDIWHSRLAYGFLDETKEQPGAPMKVKDIAEKHGISANTVSNYVARIRERIRVYILARLKEYTNEMILDAYLPKLGNKKSQTYGDSRECRSIALKIAALVRPIPMHQSLIGVFTAYVSLYSDIEPQHQDPWTFKRWLCELWHWRKTLNQALLAEAFGVEVDEPTDGPELKMVCEQLHQCRSFEDWRRFIEDRRNSAVLERAFGRARDYLTDGYGLRDLVSSNQLKSVAENQHYWIIPVCYHCISQGLVAGEDQATMRALKIQSSDLDVTNALLKNVAVGSC